LIERGRLIDPGINPDSNSLAVLVSRMTNPYSAISDSVGKSLGMRPDLRTYSTP
jgi:hypothetical protein